LEYTVGGKGLERAGSGIEIFHEAPVLSEHDGLETRFYHQVCQVVCGNSHNSRSGLQLNHPRPRIGTDGFLLRLGRAPTVQLANRNFWKGNLLVTVIGQDSEEETVQGVIALAKAVDGRIAKTGERPGLAGLLLREPLAFSHPKYVRGPLGVMNGYILDTEDVFRVREGLIGAVDDCRAFVFRYADEGESAEAFEHAATSLSASPKFMSRALQGKQVSMMVGREKELVVIHQTGRYIAIVIGQNQDKVKSTSERLVEKLKNG